MAVRADNIRGFTLLELLVVMVLLGLSMSIVLPGLFKWHDANMRESELAKLRQLVQTQDDIAYLSNKKIVLTAEGAELALSDGEDRQQYRFEHFYFPEQRIEFMPSGIISKQQLIAEAGQWRIEIEL